MKRQWIIGVCLVVSMVLCLVLVTPPAFGQAKKAPAKPCERKVFFGEQHLHTQNSPDAYVMGTRNTVDDAYNFARGSKVQGPEH